jgi:small subunit ribosomal protein S17
MADEEHQDQTEEHPEAPAEEAGEAPADEEAPAEEATAEEAPAAEVSEAPEPEPEAEAAPGADVQPVAEPEEVLGPKQRRKLERSQAQGPALPPRSPEERAAERDQRRREAKERRRRYRASRKAKRGEPGTGTPPAERAAAPAVKVRQGTVASSKADKTITVQLEIVRRHPMYEKVVRRSHTVHAHDERNEASEGDTVRIIESRPLSRSKRWRLLEIVQRAPARTPSLEPAEEAAVVETGGAPSPIDLAEAAEPVEATGGEA